MVIKSVPGIKHLHTVIIGGGQAGLATGYGSDFSWLEMNATDETGWPITKRGISSTNNGLYFVGMPFQFGLTSGLVGGVGRDAEYVSRHILNY